RGAGVGRPRAGGDRDRGNGRGLPTAGGGAANRLRDLLPRRGRDPAGDLAVCPRYRVGPVHRSGSGLDRTAAVLVPARTQVGILLHGARRQPGGPARIARRRARGRSRAPGGIDERGAGLGSALPPLLMKRPRTPQGFFDPLEGAVVGAPLLPIESYLALADEDSPAGIHWRTEGDLAVPADPLVKLALSVGSGQLVDALDRRGGSDPDVRGKLLRYQIRMSTRPTPYGMFAGVALAGFGQSTAMALEDASPTWREVGSAHVRTPV